MIKKYRIEVSEQNFGKIIVEAESVKEAVKLAQDELDDNGTDSVIWLDSSLQIDGAMEVK